MAMAAAETGSLALRAGRQDLLAVGRAQEQRGADIERRHRIELDRKGPRPGRQLDPDVLRTNAEQARAIDHRRQVLRHRDPRAEDLDAGAVVALRQPAGIEVDRRIAELAGNLDGARVVVDRRRTIDLLEPPAL